MCISKLAICVFKKNLQIREKNAYKAFEEEILHYTIYKSMFDVVMAALLRFSLLILFYAILYVNHWFVVAVSVEGFILENSK